MSWHTWRMEYLNITFRLLAISQVILFTLFIAFSDNPKRVKVVGIGLMLGIMSYVGMPLVDRYTPHYENLRFMWFFGATVPSMLLLFVFFIFEESCQVPKWMLALISVSMGASAWFHIIDLGLPGSPLWLQILKCIITLTAISVVWRGRDNDLVELRAKARNIFIFVFSVETLVIIFVEVVTHFEPPILIDTMTQFCILVFTLAMNYVFSRLNPDAKLMLQPIITAPIEPKEANDPVIAQLLERMREERLYADHDLRVGTLAQSLKIPEYKLRQKINQELGYRNFNQFVNHYRIEEAGIKLREDTRTPVLTIALDVGFRSISSFNSAFQARFGLSPTKYRTETLTDT